MIPTETSGSGLQQRATVALRLVLALLVITFVVSRVDATAILDAARNADPFWIALAVALLPVNLALEALTWQPILRRVVSRVRFRETLISVLSGYPIGFFTPARVGDFAGRALSINRGDRTQIGLSAAIARVPDLAAILLAGTIVLIVLSTSGPQLFPGADLLCAFSGAALLVVLCVVFIPSFLHRAVAQLPILKRFERRLRFLAELPVPVMGRVLCISVARLSVYSGQFVLLAFALAPTIEPIPTVAAVVLTFLAKSVVPPVTFLDLGIREGAAVFFFGLLGLGSAVGFDAALMLFVVNLVVPAIVGLPLIARFRLATSPNPRPVPATDLRT